MTDRRNPTRRLGLRAVAISLAGVGLAGATRAIAAPPTSDYKLVFADEFNGTTLDTMKWNYNYSWGQTHNHSAYMDPSQVKISGGVLNLQAVHVRNPNAPAYVDTGDFGRQYLDYTSGAINSQGKFNATTGYFEASAKLSPTAGTWPAFWMLQNGWPPEIDIMEYPRGANNSTNQYWANYHYTNASNAHASYGWQDSVGNLSTAYHTYGMAWTTTTMSFYLDGALRHTINDANAIADAAGMYMILNNAVGGWAGLPTDPSTFTADYLVDWVRVWQKPGSTAATTTWQGTTTGASWDTAANWSAGVPKYQDLVAAFHTNALSSISTSWSNSRAIGGLSFDGTSAYTIGNAAGSLQLARSSGNATIDVAAGTAPILIAARLDLWSDTVVTTNSTNLLTVSGQIVGNKALLKAGTGMLVLSGANGQSGNTGFAGGTNSGDGGVIRLLSDAALGTSIFVMPGMNTASQVVELARGVTIANNLTTAGRTSQTFLRNNGGNAWNGNITINGTGGGQMAIEAQSGTLLLGGTLSTNLPAGTSTRTFLLRGAADGNVTGHVSDGATTKVALAKGDAGTWSLSSANTYSGGTTVAGGKLVVKNAAALGTGAVVITEGTLDLAAGLTGAVVMPSLSVASPGKVDIRDNSLVIDYAAGASAATLNGLQSALLAGTIVSSSSATDPRIAIGYADASTLGVSSFDGTSVDASAAIVRACLGGDTNMDGSVAFSDLLALAQNYGSAGTKVWTDGDSNYDGVVDFGDLLLLAQNYSSTLAFSQPLPAGIDASFAADWALARSLVPEPTSLLAFGATAPFLRRRRDP